MILTSMLLVLVGAVTLVIGAVFRDDLTLVWVSIAACLLAAVFLVLGVARSRPKPTTAPSSGGATWSGASNGATPGRSSDGASSRSAATGSQRAADDAASNADASPRVEIMTADEAAGEAPVEEAPVEEAPVGQAPVEEGQVEEAPVGQPPTVGTASSSAADGVRFASLTDVDGVGPAKASQLHAHFSSFAALRRAGIEELMEVDGISEVLATRIRAHLDGTS